MELHFKVKAQNDLEAKRIARNMAIETLRNKGMMGRWFEVQDVEWIQRGLFGNGVLAKVHVYVEDKKIMKDNQHKKIKAFLAQEFKDVKAMLKKKSFKDFIVSNTSIGDFDVFISNNGGTLGYIIKRKGSNNTVEERFGFSNSAEAMTAGKEAISKLNKDAKIDDARVELKMGGRTIGYIEADTLSEAVRRYEEEHPENKGKVNAYMADRRFKDSSLDDFLGDLYDNGVHSKRELVRYLVEHKDVDEARARQMVNKFAQELRNAELPIRDADMADWSRDAMTRLIDQGYSPREAALRDPDYQHNGTPAMLNEMVSFGEKYMRTKREEKRRSRE